MGEEKKTLTLRDKFLSIAPSIIEKVKRFKEKNEDERTVEVCTKILKRLKKLQKKEILFKDEKGKREIDLMIYVLTSILRHFFAIDNAEAYSDKNGDKRALSENTEDCMYQTLIIETYLSSILTGAYSSIVEEYARFCDGFRTYLANKAYTDVDFGDDNWMP